MVTPRQPPGAVRRGGLKGSAGRPCGKTPLGGTSGDGTLSPGTAKPGPGPCCPPRRYACRDVCSQRLCRHGFTPRGRHKTAPARTRRWAGGSPPGRPKNPSRGLWERPPPPPQVPKLRAAHTPRGWFTLGTPKPPPLRLKAVLTVMRSQALPRG